MPPDEFWYGDPEMVVVYRNAHDIKNQLDSDRLWLAGLYAYDAFGVVVSNAFAKKGSTAKKYLENPIRLMSETEAEKQEKARKEREKVIAFFNSMQKQWEEKDNA